MSTSSETLPGKVREHICSKYCLEYLGKLDYTTDANYYKLTWGLNHETYPFVMQGEFVDEDAFYDYVVKQIAITRFYETKRFIARRITPPAFIVPDFLDPLLTFDEAHPNT